MKQTNGASPDEAILEVHGLTKVFGDGPSAVRAVDGVDLSVRRGEILLIMGPSGSGKTTLLTMIGGLLRPTSGSVRINGFDITAMKESELPEVRRHLLFDLVANGVSVQDAGGQRRSSSKTIEISIRC